MLFQDKWRDGVAVLKFRIIVEVRFEKFDLLLLNIAWLDGCEDAGFLAIFHFPRAWCFLQGGRFGARGSGDAQVPEL